MTDIFGSAATWFGNVLGTDAATGGFVLGFVFVLMVGFTLLILASVFLKARFEGLAIVIPFIAPFIFVTLVGWWPLWVAILVAFICAVIIVGSSKFFGDGGPG